MKKFIEVTKVVIFNGKKITTKIILNIDKILFITGNDVYFSMPGSLALEYITLDDTSITKLKKELLK